MNGGLADGTIVLNVHKDKVHEDSYRLCLHISHARLGENLDLRSCIRPSITTNSPSVEIKACGARILYEQDMVEFIQILSQRNFWHPDLSWGPNYRSNICTRIWKETKSGKKLQNICLDSYISTSFSVSFPN